MSTKLSSNGTPLSVGVIGSRSLPYTLGEKVGDVTEDLIARKYHIATGGAMGADQFVVQRLLRSGQSTRGTIYTPWANYGGFPVKTRAMTRQFKDQGGHLLWGPVAKGTPKHMVKTGLLIRNKRLVEASHGLVAFIDGNSRGSIFTIKEAVKKRLIVVVFPHNCEPPEIGCVRWHELRCGGCWDGAFKAVYVK